MNRNNHMKLIYIYIVIHIEWYDMHIYIYMCSNSSTSPDITVFPTRYLTWRHLSKASWCNSLWLVDALPGPNMEDHLPDCCLGHWRCSQFFAKLCQHMRILRGELSWDHRSGNTHVLAPQKMSSNFPWKNCCSKLYPDFKGFFSCLFLNPQLFFLCLKISILKILTKSDGLRFHLHRYVPLIRPSFAASLALA